MGVSYGKHLAFPFHIGSDGRTATVEKLEDHVKDEFIQLVLTNPGERLNYPEFGGGVRILLFEGADKNTEGMAKARITQALSRWLGHRVSIEHVEVSTEQEGKIEIDVKYRIAGTEDTRVLRFQRDAGSPGTS